MKLIRILSLALWVAGVVRAAAPVVPAVSPEVAAVLKADEARVAAMIAGDTAALEGIYAEGATMLHSGGGVETKADYIKNLKSGQTGYPMVKVVDLRALQSGSDVVVLWGLQEMQKKNGAKTQDLKLRFVAIWRKDGAKWRLSAWQNLRPPMAGPMPSKG